MKLKSLKGYLQIDIAFAILIFFLLFFTIYTLNKDTFTSKNRIMTINALEMNARDICAIISTPGIPNNWDELSSINQTKVFGLKSISSNELDSNKISYFTSTNFFTIKNRFNEDSFFNLKIIGIETTNTYLDFGTSLIDKDVKTGHYNCYSMYNSEPVKIIVEVWK